MSVYMFLIVFIVMGDQITACLPTPAKAGKAARGKASPKDDLALLESFPHEETRTREPRKNPFTDFDYCEEGQTSCCLHPFAKRASELELPYVFPQTIPLNYCQGHCRLEGSVHSQLLNKGSSCCHATEFEPIKVTYYDGNGVLQSEWLEGAVATKCACS